jgi:4-hydroxy-tetrahydrodipicolinate synthase
MKIVAPCVIIFFEAQFDFGDLTMAELTGVFAAAVTPLKPDFSPDLEGIPALLDFFIARGCHGILLLGTTGEGPSFSPQERHEILRTAARYRDELVSRTAQKVQLLAGTGTPSLSETINLTREAFDLGLDAVVVLPPYYYRKSNDTGLFLYFQQLLNRAVPADGKLLGYHIPSLTGVGFSLDLIARLKDAFPLQFSGIKDSSHDEDFTRKLGMRFGPDLQVFTGTDSLFQLALENHACGCITAPANLYSPLMRRIWDGFKEGKDISNQQAELNKLRHILEQYPPFPPILKALLARWHGFPAWPVRPPLENIDRELVECIAKELPGESA